MKTLAEGFPEQRLMRLPEQIVGRARRLPVCRDVLCTDLGHYPNASRHEVQRPQGCPNHIVILCVAGEGWVRIGRHRLVVPARRLLLIPAGVPHAYGSSFDAPWRVYWVHFTGERSEEHMRYLRGDPPQVVRRVTGLTEICESFEMLWRHRDEGGSEPGLMRMSAELCLLLVILHTRLRVGDAPSGTEERIERALERMRNGIGEPLRLKDFARVAGISPPHFSALFRAHTGVPPMTYFNRLRMQHAAESLDISSETVSSIALRVGYENPFHFSRAFRRTQGLSPRAYRQRLRG